LAPEPAGERPRPAPRCPHCGATRGTVISLFGTQAMTLQYRCERCGDVYEALKYTTGEEGEAGRR
jgi:uncharacterized Zn finger protein